MGMAAMALSPDGRRVVIAGAYPGPNPFNNEQPPKAFHAMTWIRMHDTQTGACLWKHEEENVHEAAFAGFKALRFSPDGRLLAGEWKDDADHYKVRLLNPSTGKTIHTIKWKRSHNERPLSLYSYSPLCFSPDSSTLVTRSATKLYWWDIRSLR
jgi:WD40 repeat protein